MKYLIETTEVYRVSTEDEAKVVIEEAKKKSEVIKYNCVYRCKKQKGEIVEDWYKVTVFKRWTDEKEPTGCTKVTYGLDSAWEEDDNGEN